MTTLKKNVEQVSTNKNSGKPYTDEELRVIFSLAPTKTNINFLADLLGRSERAIELQYQLAMAPKSMIEEKNRQYAEKWWREKHRKTDTDCRRIAKEMGWLTVRL